MIMIINPQIPESYLILSLYIFLYKSDLKEYDFGRVGFGAG